MLDFAKELLEAFEKVCRTTEFKVSVTPKNKWDNTRVNIIGRTDDGRLMELTLAEELPDAD